MSTSAGVPQPHPHLVRNLTIALIAALVAAVVALSIALATEDSSSTTTQVRVIPAPDATVQNFTESTQPGGARLAAPAVASAPTVQNFTESLQPGGSRP